MCISHFVSCRGRLCASYGGLTVEFMVNGLPVQTATGDGTLVNIVSQRQTTMSEGCRVLPTCSSCCVFSTLVSFQFNTCIWTGLVGVSPSSTVTRTREFNLTKRKDIEHAVKKNKLICYIVSLLPMTTETATILPGFRQIYEN